MKINKNNLVKKIAFHARARIMAVINEIKNVLGLDITDAGERVFINYFTMNYDSMDMYQKSHFRRYIFARERCAVEDVVGDMACGTGYGSLLLSEKVKKVEGFDIDKKVIDIISKKYSSIEKVSFVAMDLLKLDEVNVFDKIVSFETVEHIEEKYIGEFFENINRALKNRGILIFSTPYNQEDSVVAREMGFHKIFNITEQKIKQWLENSNFQMLELLYQNYDTHEILKNLDKKDFIICVAQKS